MSVENLGGALPKLRQVTFQGCDDAKGFAFRYVTPAGRDVTWAVTHDGYTHSARAHERAWLNVWITSTQSDRSLACELSGVGNGPSDAVKVWAHS